MRFSVLIFSSFIALSLSAQLNMDSRSQQVVNELTTVIYPDVITQDWLVKNLPTFPIYKVNGEFCLSMIAEKASNFTDEDLNNLAYVGSEAGNIITLKVPLVNLVELNILKNLDYLEVAIRIQPDIEDMITDTRVDSVWQGINQIQSYTGKNVLIGITDWGFDYGHPMFMDTTLTTSRIRAAWDQFKVDGDLPTGMNYGVEYNTPSELVAAESDTASTYYDYATHGSHVAGITAGSGAGTIHRGVAFEAEYLFNSIQLDAGSAIDAFNWMKGIADADNKRLVINMSWGLYYLGTLDGNSVLSQAIDALSAQGVLFVTSAGNNGNDNFHIKKEFNQDTITSRIMFYGYAQHASMWGQSISMWGEQGQTFSAVVEVYNSSNVLLATTPVFETLVTGYEDSVLVIGLDTVFYNVEIDAPHPQNSKPHIRLRVKNTNTTYKVMLKSFADAGEVHYWNVVELSNDVGNWGLPFVSYGSHGVSGDAEYGIGEPACAASVITVASHSPVVYSQSGIEFPGSLSSFSSQGPLYNGNMKPDVSAPGGGIISSINSYTTGSYSTALSITFNGKQYDFSSFSGTSMSSPATAGVAALILEANPYLTPAEVKEVIKNSARQDNKTGTITAPGSTSWGMGKVTATDAIQLAEATVGTYAQSSLGNEFIVYPNPATDVLNIEPFNNIKYYFQIFSSDGKLVRKGSFNNSTRLNISDLNAGMYHLILSNDFERTNKSFIVTK